MNGIDFLADTNILIQINNGNKNLIPFLELSTAVSFITEIELLGANNLSKKAKDQFKEMLQDCFVIDLNEEIKKTCIMLRNNYKIKTPDAIIAATAIVYELPLLTSDNDFIKINQLKVIYLEN